MGIRVDDTALRRGLGLAGKAIGTSCKVYRLGGRTGVANAAQSIIDPLNLVYPALQVRFTNGVPKVVQEQEPIYKLLYLGMCDARRLKIGDVLVETGPLMPDTPDGRVFTFCSASPLLPAVFARTEVFSQLSRTGDPSAAPLPLQGKAPPQGESKQYELILELKNSDYDMTYVGISATIPIGLQPRERPGPKLEFSNPTMTPRGAYVAYVPLLPGFQIQPGDYLTDSNGNRYRIEIASMFTTGIQGYQLFVDSVLT